MYKVLLGETHILRLADNAGIPIDNKNKDYQDYLEWLSDGNTPEPVELPPVTLTDYQDAVQRRLDEKAMERKYDGILSLCTYVTSTNPGFAAEGQAGVGWRDAAWAKCYEVLTEVGAGTRPQPTVAELLAELPAMDWPT